MAAASQVYEWKTESYMHQMKTFWPQNGRHILAQFDQDTVIVYQAYNNDIADYAVKNQSFGGPAFSYERMSWIKTNFLWMMYRCGWASKRNQERILAIRITRAGFEDILKNAFTAWLQRSEGLSNYEVSVRLQWDPDHTPTYEKCERRAIQLGLKGEILKKYGTQWIVKIDDVTQFVHKQRDILAKQGEQEVEVASERVYHVDDPDLVSRLRLDSWDDSRGDEPVAPI